MQDANFRQAADIWKLLSGTETDIPACIYVRGFSNMSRDVRTLFGTMSQRFGAAHSKELHYFISQLIG